MTFSLHDIDKVIVKPNINFFYNLQNRNQNHTNHNWKRDLYFCVLFHTLATTAQKRESFSHKYTWHKQKQKNEYS